MSYHDLGTNLYAGVKEFVTVYEKLRECQKTNISNTNTTASMSNQGNQDSSGNQKNIIREQ